MIKKSYVPFYQSLIWPLAENFSILLSNLLKKIEIQVFFDTEATTARKNKKIRLWSTGNSYSNIQKKLNS